MRRAYNDRLMMFMLRNRTPDRFAQRQAQGDGYIRRVHHRPAEETVAQRIRPRTRHRAEGQAPRHAVGLPTVLSLTKDKARDLLPRSP